MRPLRDWQSIPIVALTRTMRPLWQRLKEQQVNNNQLMHTLTLILYDPSQIVQLFIVHNKTIDNQQLFNMKVSSRSIILPLIGRQVVLSVMRQEQHRLTTWHLLNKPSVTKQTQIAFLTEMRIATHQYIEHYQ